MQTLTIVQPDDWHLHLRDGEALKSVLPDTARRFARAIVMPNLKLPVTTVALAAAYRQRILDAVPARFSFQPLMTLYLTDDTPATEIEAAQASGFVHGVKLYPAGATTNSAAGVTSVAKCTAVLARMEKLGMPLLVHGEVTDPVIDVFDREAVFIDRILQPLQKDFPGLRVVFEHITTTEAADYVKAATPHTAATITAHHLLFSRNAMFQGGMRPHYYCLPVLKRETHRQALLRCATSGSPKFFLGTDSAPHGRRTKEAACGCAGCYTAHAGIELYAEAFDAANALDRLEGFASLYGADFYGLPHNTERLTLVKQAWQVSTEQPFLADDVLVPFRGGERIAWSLQV